MITLPEEVLDYVLESPISSSYRNWIITTVVAHGGGECLVNRRAPAAKLEEGGQEEAGHSSAPDDTVQPSSFLFK